MKRTLIFTIVALYIFNVKGQSLSQSIDSLITRHIAEVNQDSLYSFVSGLQNFGSRQALNENRKDVALWIQNKFMSFGIDDVVLDSFQVYIYDTLTWQFNVVATIPGQLDDLVYIVGAHHDSYASIDSAPGADDNASGTAAALEIARCVSQLNYIPEKTFKFMTFAAEEFGLHGSHHYAREARSRGEKIQLMINNDMIGNSNDVSWNTVINSYTGYRDVAEKADQLFEIYTNVNGIVSPGNARSSDSYSFFVEGFPTVFFIEEDFSPVYHSWNDLTDFMNFEYLAENVKLSYALLLSMSEAPIAVNNFFAYDVGDGQSVELVWDESVESDIIAYEINYYLDSNLVNSFTVNDENSLVINDLEESNAYVFTISAIDSEDNSGQETKQVQTPMLMPRVPESIELISSKENLVVTWIPNSERDIKGYNLYSTDILGGNPVLRNNSVVTDTFYVDNEISIGEVYYYYVTAVDNDNNESILSTEYPGALISFSEGILIVDDSRGGIGNPTEDEVDSFYENLFEGRNYTHHDISEDGKLTIVDFGKYSSIVWHINNIKVDKPYLFEAKDHLKKYLDAGGNLLLTLYEFSKDIDWNTTYPVKLNDGDFIHDYLKVDSIFYMTDAMFNQAISNSNEYESLTVDQSKTNMSVDYHFNRVEAIYPTNDANIIYTYGTDFFPSSREGAMLGTPVGVEYLGNDFQVVSLSFPLYYMNADAAKEFIDDLFDNKFNKNLNVPFNTNSFENNNLSFTLYPNPCLEKGNINFKLDKSDFLSVEVLSSNGALVKNIYHGNLSSGNHSLNYNINDLEAGIYYVRVKSSAFVETQKLIKGN